MIKNLIIENLIIDIAVLKLFQWKWNFKRNYCINKPPFVFLYSQLFHIVEWKWFLRIWWQIHQQTTWIEMSMTAFYLHDITVILISIYIKMLIWYRSSILCVIICFIETKRVFKSWKINQDLIKSKSHDLIAIISSSKAVIFIL